jgi:uncharacterized protein
MSLILVLSLVGFIVFVTHTLEAITGFGCTVLAFPFVIAIMGDLELAKIVLSVLAWVLAGYFVVTKFKSIHWKQFGIILLFAGLGLPIGMLLFKNLDAIILKKILGIFIVISAGIQLFKIYFSDRKIGSVPGIFNYVFLFLGGIVHGAFAVGGPLIVLYSAKKITDKGQFRATMCLLWTTLNTILMVQYFFEKKLTATVGFDLLFLLPFLIGGIILGEIIHTRVSEDLFKKIIFNSLLLVGLTMTIAG